MSGEKPGEGKARAEAADWFARLKSRVVSTETIEEFYRWRQEPANLDAYHQIENMWRAADPLAADDEVKAAIKAAIERPAQRAAQRAQRLRWGSGLCCILVLGVVGAVFGPAAMDRWLGTPYATPVGVESTVQLQDGSTVRLDTASRIRVRFADRDRVVQLEHGQAFFSVRHDATRPFHVLAGGSRIQDLGTQFDVRLDHGRARVTLVEGSVQVSEAGRSAAPSPWTLRPGQQLLVGAAKPAQIRAVDPTVATSWTNGRLVFQSTPLAEAVREVARYSPNSLRLADDREAATPVDGMFDIGNVGAFVTAVTSDMPLKAERGADGSITLVAKPAA